MQKKKSMSSNRRRANLQIAYHNLSHNNSDYQKMDKCTHSMLNLSSIITFCKHLQTASDYLTNSHTRPGLQFPSPSAWAFGQRTQTVAVAVAVAPVLVLA